MSSELIEKLRSIRTFPSLVKYLRDDLGWPLSAEEIDELVFEYEPDELGIDPQIAVKIKEIKQLRPLAANQPWGIFYIGFEPKQLPVVVLRRILQKLVIKKRQTARSAHRNAWELHDLLFISSYGEENERSITFAHFSEDEESKLPTLRVIGWDSQDTPLHIDRCISELSNLAFDEELSPGQWRDQWSRAFTLKHREVISTSKALAKELAALAARIRQRVNKVLAIESEKGPMRQLYKAFQETLVHDLSEDDFADMYAQTITYGLFTTKKSRPAGLVAENLVEMVPRTNPFLRELLSTFLTVGGRTGKIDFDELGIDDVVQTLRNTDMDAVMRDFGDSKPEEDPVIHFYEDFLKEYDAQKKVKRGVFYTPKPVVSFIVRSVNELLQKEFGLEDGLADTTTWGEMVRRNNDIKIPEGVSENEPFVQILDPAVGTGTFLVEAIDVIYKTMKRKWEKQGYLPLEFIKLWNEYVPRHLLPRLYGFELMMAPYAIAHMKIGLKLFETGYRFVSDERLRIYLTNSLEPPQDFSDRFEFDAPALAHEAKDVNIVKRQKRFTVIIGNPPYAGHSRNNEIKWIVDLVKDFTRDEPSLQGPGQGKWLQDDYVKFLRFGQHILTSVSFSILAMITNHRYLTNRTFKGMRRQWMAHFPLVRILDLHGNKVVHEVSPLGFDENVFDIEQGVAIGMFLKGRLKKPDIAYAELWGTRTTPDHKGKYDFLARHSFSSTVWKQVNPKLPDWLFASRAEFGVDLRAEFDDGLKMHELMPRALGPNGKPQSGLATMHDNFALSFSVAELEEKMRTFLRTENRDEAKEIFGTLCNPQQWDYAAAKKTLSSPSWRQKISAIWFSPFDTRFTVYDKAVAVHLRRRLSDHLFKRRNLALVIGESGQEISGDNWDAVSCVNGLLQLNYFRRNGSPTLPLYLYDDDSLNDPDGRGRRPNFSTQALKRFADKLELPTDNNGLPQGISPEDIFHYTYAVFHSPEYRRRYAEFLKIDFPRVLLTSNLELFRALANLGGELVSLHLMETDKLNKHITKWLGPTPISEVEKVIWSDDTVWINKSKTEGFKGVPENVWNFHIGGYQVCYKWLSDRKGRKLSAKDIEHYHKIVVALNETIRIMMEIDEVIAAHAGWPNAFTTK